MERRISSNKLCRYTSVIVHIPMKKATMFIARTKSPFGEFYLAENSPPRPTTCNGFRSHSACSITHAAPRSLWRSYSARDRYARLECKLDSYDEGARKDIRNLEESQRRGEVLQNLKLYFHREKTGNEYDYSIAAYLYRQQSIVVEMLL